IKSSKHNRVQYAGTCPTIIAKFLEFVVGTSYLRLGFHV
ncbi:hypothetical protein LCGC14_2837400, partial [marine sediment metagenome]